MKPPLPTGAVNPAAANPADAPAPPSRPERIASPLHTAVLVLLVLAVSLSGAKSQHAFTERHGRMTLYGITIIWEWLLVAYIAWGIRKRSSLRELIGGRWKNSAALLADLGIAAGFWVVALVILGLLGRALGLAHANQLEETRRQIGYLAPNSQSELAMFLALSATAGFCEEIIFRGYLLRQFTALSHSAVAGLALQALLFGAGHGYEGGRRMILIAVYGAMFGLLARGRKTLRPGMVAHFLHDASAGIMLKMLR